LLVWNHLSFGTSSFYSSPVGIVAILIHDYPIEAENHPLPKLLLEAISGGKEYATLD